MLSLVLVSLAAVVAFLFPLTRYGVGSIVGTVAAMSIVADPLALAVVLIGVAWLVSVGPSVAPSDPAYLHRAPVDTARTVRIRVLDPVWDATVRTDPVGAMAEAASDYDQADRSAELIRLRTRLDRAVSSRHRTRADGIRAKINALTWSA